MVDEVDHVQELQLRRTERAVRAVQSFLEQDGADDCTDCGNPIPAARRQAYPAARRCVVCQGYLERREA
ncbi:transcriptional regulator, TraR/DksA family [Tistlia consotensis]|uniref:Transcriptional regulator, TraR/DksA family n=1 Tax=Tistlia consotensis USBA 355 TaxID=560819 RepID=A0A1Y6CRG4_9PROT|nr:TraR/DksA C4-type zinc finger protein [Tistlia consotensis]SMF85796.1 transcriptional regulator, TraR/DksA family [Tistlia consotensis USBA 355]SNS37833.1 transcriptional regulator, TraR/DksA family [Tistlia consotensis]